MDETTRAKLEAAAFRGLVEVCHEQIRQDLELYIR